MKKIMGGFLEFGQVHYIDFDMQFSSLIQNMSDEEYSKLIAEGLALIQPGDDSLDVISFFASKKKLEKGGVIILDSMNSLQSVLSNNSSSLSSKIANYRSSIFITVIQLISRFYSKSLIILNVTKARPRPQADHSVLWEKEMVGGRMIRYKSDVILVASELKNLDEEKSNPWAKIVVDRKSGLDKETGEENVYSVDL